LISTCTVFAPVTEYPGTEIVNCATSDPRVAAFVAEPLADEEGSAKINIAEGGGSGISLPGPGPFTENAGCGRQTRT
jgi:hypothetical protein